MSVKIVEKYSSHQPASQQAIITKKDQTELSLEKNQWNCNEVQWNTNNRILLEKFSL